MKKCDLFKKYKTIDVKSSNIIHVSVSVTTS